MNRNVQRAWENVCSNKNNYCEKCGKEREGGKRHYHIDCECGAKWYYTKIKPEGWRVKRQEPEVEKLIHDVAEFENKYGIDLEDV